MLHLHVAGLVRVGPGSDERDSPDDDGGAFGDQTVIFSVL